MKYLENFNKWMHYEFLDSYTKKKLNEIKDNDEVIKECFFDYLPFGTAGMRGLMGVGINRINIYTIRRVTQGIANYLKDNNLDRKTAVVIYDTRNNSYEFAKEVALTFAANGINTYMFDGVRPTPFLSFAVRNLKTAIGINITASHNSKEYNGYKVYLSDGAQFSYPEDEKIIEYVNKVSDISICKTMDYETALKQKKIIKLKKDLDVKFEKEALGKIINKEYVKKHGNDLIVVYTPLHGTGSKFLNSAIKKAGFTNLYIVKEQDDKNGEFKTLKYPNPESKNSFDLALDLAKKKNADIVVATDPDCDRLGVYVKNKKNKYLPLTGNELSSIILEYILHNLDKNKYKKSFVAKSFVTTRLIDAICKNYGIDLVTTLTGFKWIGKEILNNKKKFIFGAEESYGFLVDDYVRDKDAVSATLITLEIALILKEYGVDLIEFLQLIFERYGLFKNYNFNLEFNGISGMENMNNIMSCIRNSKLEKITDIEVLYKIDYLLSEKIDIKNGIITKINMPKNNTIAFYLNDDSVITIRPSGTEPKIKIYYDIKDNDLSLADNKFEILNSAILKMIKEIS